MDIGKALSDAAHGFTTPTREQIQHWLDCYFPFARDPNAWRVLHIAASQLRGCSNLILELAWASKDWKPLFNDPSYLDKYGYQVWEQISQPFGPENAIPLRQQIYAEANREKADELRKFRIRSEEEIAALMDKYFDYLSSPALHILHSAASREHADPFLRLAWQSDRWRPLFHRMHKGRTVFQALKDSLDEEDYELEGDSAVLRSEIILSQ